MTKSRTQIQKDSDAKRGVKTKAFKLPIAFIEEFEQLARTLDMSNNAFLMHVVECYKQSNRDTK